MVMGNGNTIGAGLGGGKLRLIKTTVLGAFSDSGWNTGGNNSNWAEQVVPGDTKIIIISWSMSDPSAYQNKDQDDPDDHYSSGYVSSLSGSGATIGNVGVYVPGNHYAQADYGGTTNTTYYLNWNNGVFTPTATITQRGANSNEWYEQITVTPTIYYYG